MAMLAKTGNRLGPLWARDPFTAFRDEISDLRNQIIGHSGDWFGGAMIPSLDMSETEDALEVKMDLPGTTAKEIDIQVVGNVLTVSGQRKEEKEEKGKTFHRAECRYGSFCRAVTLPCSVNENEVAAEYRDGVLTIKLPKCEEAKAHKVKVKD